VEIFERAFGLAQREGVLDLGIEDPAELLAAQRVGNKNQVWQFHRARPPLAMKER
jgi:hypothetical protein